tara:strand:+ start:238 stop:786 length:549 start_codon:yes stop_codon:yes gene_type:complete
MVKISTPHPDITQYDGVFTEPEQHMIASWCASMPFKIDSLGMSDDEMNINSKINPSQWYSSSNRLKDCFEKTLAFRKLSDHTLMAASVDVYTIADCQDIRCFPSTKLIIYFTNIKWMSQYGGDIIFYDQHAKSVICIIPCVPNRMIVFEGDLIHRISTPNKHNMLTTFTAILKKKQEESKTS